MHFNLSEGDTFENNPASNTIIPADSSLVSSIEGKDGGIERTICTAHHYHLIPIPTLCPVDYILATMERERTTYCYRSYFGGGPTATTRDLLSVVVSPPPTDRRVDLRVEGACL